MSSFPDDSSSSSGGFFGTDQLQLQWQTNPSIPLSSLTIVVDANTKTAIAMNQQSKPAGMWNAKQGKLAWVCVSEQQSSPPVPRLMARFQMRGRCTEPPTTVVGDHSDGASGTTTMLHDIQRQPVNVRFEGHRDKPLSELTFSVAAIIANDSCINREDDLLTNTTKEDTSRDVQWPSKVVSKYSSTSFTFS
jgi:hypothetical protein